MKIIIKSLFILCFLILSCDDIGIETNNIIEKNSFVHAFGSDWYDYGWGLAQINDGGFILIGRKEYKESNSKDMIVIRTDQNGLGIWERNYGGSADEEGYSAIQTPDGNILSVGYSWSYGNKQEIFVVKTTLSGGKVWQKTFGGSNRDIGHKAILSSDGNIIIVGQSNSPGISRGNDDVIVQKIDQGGNQLWLKAYGKQNHEVGYDIVELESGDFLIVGYREFYNASGKDILIIKIDSEGNQLWEKIIGVDGLYEEIAHSISKSKINGYIICASTNASGNDRFDPQLIKIDFAGNVDWNRTYSGSGLKHTRWVATSTIDGGATILGTTNYYRESGSNEDAYLLKVDSKGNKISDISIQGGYNDWGWDIIETFFGDLVIIGSTKSYGSGLYDILLARIINSVKD